MRPRRLSGIILLTLSFFAGSAFADTAEIDFFRGIMSPLNVVPSVAVPAGAPATVICHVVRDSSGNITSASVDFLIGYGLPGQVTFTGLDIYSGAQGTNGQPVIHTTFGNPTPVQSDPSGFGLIDLETEVLPTDQTGLAALAGMLKTPDQYYVELKTTDYPNGFLRAPLNRATFIVPMSLMSSANVVPAPSGAAATAAGQLVVLTAHDSSGNISSTQLIFDVNYNLGKQTTITGLRVHRGAAGANGPVTIDSGLGSSPFYPAITTNSSGTGNLRQFAEVDMTNPDAVATVVAMLTHPKDYYMDITTTDAPNGAVRDQMRGTELVKTPVTMVAPGATSNNTVPYAPTLLLIRTLRAADGTPLMGSLMWICNFRFPGATQFTGLDIYNGAPGAGGTRQLSSGISPTQPYPTDTGFGNILLFPTVSDPVGVAALGALAKNPDQFYIALSTGQSGTVAVQTQLAPTNTALPAVTSVGNSANGGGAAPGAMISIYGTNLAKITSDPYDARPAQAPGLTAWFGPSLPTNYNGTTVTIGGLKAGLAYVAPGQINAQVPYGVQFGSQPVVVSNSNGAGTATTITIGDLWAPAIVVNSAGPAIYKMRDSSLVSTTNPASAGDTLLVYATGLGQTIPALTDGQITPATGASTSQPVTAQLGGVNAPVSNSVSVPYFAGLYTVTLTVPSGIPSGSAKLQLQMPTPGLAIFGATNLSTSSPVNVAIK